jgi:2-dehydropantoate 2-reductase
MASIAIVGPGAIGGVIAGSLEKRGGHTLSLCARRALAGLTVELPSGSWSLRMPIRSDPAQAGAVDWVLVTTKAYDAAGAAAWFPRLVGPATRVAVLQNGVEQRERFTHWLPADRILPVMIDCPAERPAPDRVIQRGPGRMAVPAGADGTAFVELFSGIPWDVQAVPDFTTVVWRKLCLNAAGILNALLLKPNFILRDENVARLARTLVDECVAVGRAEGAVLEDGIADGVVASYRKAAPDGVNSLLADRRAGRPMEIDARNGAIVRFGRKHGIPTPGNEMAAILLAAM